MRGVILGSASPRRRLLLEEAGWRVEQRPPAIDDGRLEIDAGTPEATVAALAWFKAAQIAPPEEPGIAVIAADTVCAVGDRILGKPRDLDDASAMLRLLAGGRHRTLTGVCVLDRTARRRMFVDASIVTFGDLEDAEIDAYLATDAWTDKAGGYNLADRIAAGWPIECEGDPTTVMGLPMRRLVPMLEAMTGSDDREGS